MSPISVYVYVCTCIYLIFTPVHNLLSRFSQIFVIVCKLQDMMLPKTNQKRIHWNNLGCFNEINKCVYRCIFQIEWELRMLCVWQFIRKAQNWITATWCRFDLVSVYPKRTLSVYLSSKDPQLSRVSIDISTKTVPEEEGWIFWRKLGTELTKQKEVG